MKEIIVNGAQVISGLNAVWVNAPDGHCIARFGFQGIDVHRRLDQQGVLGECLACTHGRTTPEDWTTFRELVLHHHGVAVPDDMRPGWMNS